MTTFNRQLSNITNDLPEEESCPEKSSEGMTLPSIKVTGVAVTSRLLEAQVQLIVCWAKQRLSKVVCLANVHMLIESRGNVGLRNTLSNADLVTPDGMPLVWVMRSLGARNQDRVAGMDVFKKVCQQCEQENVSIYLFGSTQAVLNKMTRRISEDFPQLCIAGTESPPFRPLSEEENSDIVRRINRSGAGITFISLGCPKQEQWMGLYSGSIRSVMIGVGAVFPVYAGVLQHAPKWIRQNGLEWLYRWTQEPRRLSGRYLKTIPLFICLALQQIQAEKMSHLFHTVQNTLTENILSIFGKAKQPLQ